ncbi:MAG: alkyl sulfatase dimerization domain-containing protein [Steroidobacteraceae bacterium]
MQYAGSLTYLPILLATAGACIAGTPQEVAPRIHPELARHTDLFAKKIYKVADNVYCAVGWNVANIVMIVGDDGIILVDAQLSPVTSHAVLEEFRKITDKPLKAIIYSHFHHDHIDGVKGLVSAGEVESGKVAIYAHSSMMANLVDESATLGPILGVRAGYSFGFFLGDKDKEGMNAGTGPLPTGGGGSFIAPTHTVDDYLKTTIAGVELEIIHVPSEAPDELAIFLPSSGVLIDTEVIQGPAFPNMHTLRGTKYRDPVAWVASIDKLRRLKPQYLVPTHGQPVYGPERAEEVLRMTRDGIQYVHDQTVRQMNKGLTPDELVEVVRLPPHLAEYTPYLREYYGTVKQAVRQIYNGYLGWFQGDPVDLDPVPPTSRAQRLVELMGGRDPVLKAARKAYEDGEYQWTAELATYLIRIDHGDSDARHLKANAFRQLGYSSININWRNWYLTSAMELDGALGDGVNAARMASIFTPADIVTETPAAISIAGWTSRLRAEDALDTRMSLGFVFTDLEESYTLTIRRGVCQFDVGLTDPDIVITLTKAAYNRFLLGTTGLLDAVRGGDAGLHGEPADLQKFLNHFEPAGNSRISLTVH